MRKKLKKYNDGGFISDLLGNLNSVPGQGGGAVEGFNPLNILSGSTSDGVLLKAMNSYSGRVVPPSLMGQYRRGSLNAAMNNGFPGQFGFMNNFMQQNQLGQFAPPPQVNTDPFQFMPQVGLQNQMDAADQALQPTGPINTAGPQVGMPVNPNVNMATAPTIAPPTVTSGTYGNFAKTGLVPTMDMQPFIDANTPANSGTTGGSGMGQANVETSLGQAILGEANEFDQAKAAVNRAKGAVSTLKKIVGEDTFKSHGAKLLSKIPGKVGEKIGEKVAASAVEGAGTKFGSFLGSNAGAVTSLGVGLLGKGIQELDKKDGNYSRLGAMGGGALQGAALGSMLGPIGTVAGGLIGTGIGELQRGKFEANARAEDLTEKTILAKDNARTRLQSKQILANVPTQGIKDQVYDEGGPVGGDDEGIGLGPLPPGVSPFSNLFRYGLDKFKENVVKNISPYGYSNAEDLDQNNSITRFIQAGLGFPEARSHNAVGGFNQYVDIDGNPILNSANERKDLLSQLLTGEQLYNTLPTSQYRPTKSSDENAVYYSSPATEQGLRERMTYWADKDRGIDNLMSMIESHPDYHEQEFGVGNVLGNYTLSKGTDDQGSYLSYYDKWDLNPISYGEEGFAKNLEEGFQSLIGVTPPEIYGRIYYDPSTGRPLPAKNLGGETGGGKTPARQKYIPEGDEITLDMISQYMTDTRSPADDPYDFSAAMDTIAYHESGMDPQRHQMAGGPGRGIVQYDEPSALAASNRLRDLSKLWGKPNPEWNTPEGTKDFSKLTVEQQKMLWMADKLMDKTVDLAALGMREEPLVDFWADHHWRGSDKDRRKRTLSFESHRLPAKALGLPEYKEEAPQVEPEIPSLTPDIELPYNPLIIGGPPREYKPDTLKISFDQGGVTPNKKGKYQGPSIKPDDPRFDQHKAYAEAMYRLRNPYGDLNLPPSGRVEYTFGPLDTVLGAIPFGNLAGTLGKRAALQAWKRYGQGRNVPVPLGKYGRRELIQGLRRDGPLFGFEQALGLDLMSSGPAQDYPLKEYREGSRQEPTPKYNYGGSTDKFDYIAEGGEVIVHKPGDVPDTDQNGYLTPLGPNVKMINGDKHSAPSGGVKMGQDENAFIYSDKLKVSKEMQNKIYGSNGKLKL